MRLVPVLRATVGSAVPVVSIVLLAVLHGVSCSAGSDGALYGPGQGGNTSDSDSGLGGGFVEQPPDSEPEMCAGQKYDGDLVPLDVYILLDATASMKGGDDKPNVWNPVVSAIQNLVSSSLTAGIGVGLTYLPVPVGDPFAQLGRCDGPFGPCPEGKGNCARPMGLFTANLTCSQQCTMATAEADCGMYGSCMVIPGSGRWCNGSLWNDSCDPLDYGKPVVAIAELPGNQTAIMSAINSKEPNGDSTPTQPALDGALRYARQWAIDHPDHLVNLLFATDGEPNNCTFNDIKGAAQVALNAYSQYPYIPTFVLGIGEIKDLNAIASAGGTNVAYMADGSTVGSQLVTVFNEIRANGACQFLIPEPANGDPLDYDRVNVFYTPLGEPEGSEVPIGQVYDLGACDPVKGGWYYDDPTKVHPTRVMLCPASCQQVQLSQYGVRVELGCKTIVW